MKKEEVKFSSYEKRVLDLSYEKKFTDAASKTVRKLIDNMPFLLEAAEYKFDQEIADILLAREGQIANAKIWAEKAIKDSIKRRIGSREGTE